MSYYRGQEVYYDNSALMAEQYYQYPQSHVLTKALGGTVTASWSVRNTSASVVSFAQLQVQIGVQAVVKGSHFAIQPGASMFLPAITSTVTAWSSNGNSVQGILNLVETDTGGVVIRTVASHVFIIQASAQGPILEAVGEPSIT